MLVKLGAHGFPENMLIDIPTKLEENAYFLKNKAHIWKDYRVANFNRWR